MDKFFEQARKLNASDLFLVSGEKPVTRIDGELEVLSKNKLTSKAIENYFFPKLTKDQKELLNKNKDIDFRLDLGKSYYRINLHYMRAGIGAAIRIFPLEVPSVDDIDLSINIQASVYYPNGLVLVTGPAGSGKSTTIASLLNKICNEQKHHIITVEDPIEYNFTTSLSLIEQREIGKDTPSYSSALKHVLRQNPDIVFIGEMRDAESVAAVLTAAETGHLIFSTLHTSTAAETIERIIDLFPAEKQQQVLGQLASVLKMVVSQKLLPKIGGGRVAAREVLVSTPAISNLIKNNNINQIKSAIQTGKKQGMVTMDQSIKELIAKKVISKDTIY